MAMKYFFGIDPGQKGAIAVVTFDGEFTIVDMPLMPDKKAVDVKKLYSFVHYYMASSSCFLILEKAQPMPKQDVTGVFSYGLSYGKLLSTIEILEVPFQEVRPQKWKKEFSLKSDKKQSVDAALKLFPKAKDLLITKRGALKDGRAEALLMAEYGRRIYVS